MRQTSHACGRTRAQIGRFGDRTSLTFWAGLDELMPKAKFMADNAILAT
ncbi:hypothetical protein J3A65_004553 [Rhizobium sp. PvP014]|jgi:hypothetical protein|nr:MULTISPECIES: hypothetical protein [unclassified Rhizobium]MBP2463726.1 hypothetical protein [Rhizobium sp. PvP014]MBP2531952.1 hypothetical protein [Rhizobium sp. PvP099]